MNEKNLRSEVDKLVMKFMDAKKDPEVDIKTRSV